MKSDEQNLGEALIAIVCVIAIMECAWHLAGWWGAVLALASIVLVMVATN